MRRLFFLSIFLVSILAVSCGGGGSSATSGGDGGDGSGTGGTTSVTIPSGSAGLFMSIRSSGSYSVPGYNITVTEGSSYIYRYVPSVTFDKFDNTLNMTNDYSCDHAGFQTSYVVGQQLFNIEGCPSYSSSDSDLDVEIINPSTGAASSACSMTANGTSSAGITLAVVDSKYFYQDGDGNLVSRSTACGTATTLLASGDEYNTGYTYYYSVGGQLVSVFWSTSLEKYYIDIRNTSTGAITSTPLELDNSEVYYYSGSGTKYAYSPNNFYAGDDALYWYIYDSDTDSVKVYRYPLSGSQELIFSGTVGDDINIMNIDESDGYVLISFRYITSRDGNNYATSYAEESYFYEVSSGDTLAVDLGDFFGSDMQFLVYE